MAKISTISHHLRSVLRTDKILVTDGHTKGWSDLFVPRIDKPNRFIFPPFAKLNHTLVKDK